MSTELGTISEEEYFRQALIEAKKVKPKMVTPKVLDDILDNLCPPAMKRDLKMCMDAKEKHGTGTVIMQVLEIAIRKNDSAAVETLAAHCNLSEELNAVYTYLPLGLACENSTPEVVAALIRCGADVNKRDSNGDSPLILACKNEKDCFEICKVLLGYGARYDDKNILGQTALHMAAKYGSLQTCKILVTLGANPKEIDERGMSPIGYAEDEDIIQYLTSIE